MSFQAVLFDLDGTLADTAPDLGAALNRLLSEHGKPPCSDAAIRAQASHGARGLLEIGFGVTPQDADFIRLRDLFLQYYGEQEDANTFPFAGITELLSELQKRQIVWGIITNKPARFTNPLVKRIFQEFSPACVVSGDTCSQAKPDPAPMHYAAQQIALDPRHCLYIGDAERDIQAGNGVGMKSIIAAYGYIGSDDTPENWGAAASILHPLEILAHLG